MAKKPVSVLKTPHTSAMEVVEQLKQAFGLQYDHEVIPAIKQALQPALHMVIEVKHGQTPNIIWTSREVDLFTAIEILQATTMGLTAKQKAANQQKAQESQTGEQLVQEAAEGPGKPPFGAAEPETVQEYDNQMTMPVFDEPHQYEHEGE
jgi:hypothetical protein